MRRWSAGLVILLVASCGTAGPNTLLQKLPCDDGRLFAVDGATACWTIDGSFESARGAFGAVFRDQASMQALGSFGTIDVGSLKCPGKLSDPSVFQFDFLCYVRILDPKGSEAGQLEIGQFYDETEMSKLKAGQAIEGFVLSYRPDA